MGSTTGLAEEGKGKMTIAEDDQDRASAVAKSMDWYDPVFREETEYDVYSLLQQHPRQRSEKTSEWYFVGHDECREAFQKPELFSNDWYAAANPLGQTSVIPENTDAPEQRAYRRVLDPMFSPQNMAKLEDEIRGFAAELLEKIVTKEKSEFVADFTMPFPTIIFCRLMGFPLEDHPRLMRWKDVYMNSQSPFIAKRLDITEVDSTGRPLPEVARKLAEDTGTEIVGYLSALLDARRAVPEDDLLTVLLAARRPDGRELTQDELIGICFNLFLGGLDTVTGMLSMIIRDFAEHPEHRTGFMSVMDDPDRVGPAVEELVRFHSIVTIARRVTEDCEFRGLNLAKDDMVQLMTPAACRDETRFPGADQIDYNRSPNPHLAFGLGWHRCLGIHLARRELKIALQEIHRVMPSYSLDPEETLLVGTGGVRGLFTLPLRIG
jgi:cytochrome P450